MAGYLHCTKNPINVFPEMKLQGLCPNSHSCICEWLIYSQDLSAYLAAAKYADWSWEYINRSQKHECGNWDSGDRTFCFGNNKSAQFHFWEYLNRNQTFILDSRWPFICCVDLYVRNYMSVSSYKLPWHWAVRSAYALGKKEDWKSNLWWSSRL